MGDMVLVLGGAKSGKTRLAQRLAAVFSPVTFVATARLDPTDPEMTARIDRHRADRPASWITKEVPLDLEGVLPGLVAERGAVVIDCVTLWITNLMLGLGGGAEMDDPAILAALDRSATAARGRATTIWVSNEVGSGIVPDNALGRRFIDLQGLANQALAGVCDAVHLCVAGLPLRLK